MLLPRLLLTAAPAKKAHPATGNPLGSAARDAAQVETSFQQFHVGRWHALLAEAKRLWPLGRASAPAADPEADDEVRKLVDRVVSLVAAGEVARAAHLLQSDGVADATDAAADMLREMLSPSPAQRPPDRDDWVNRRKSEAAGVSEKPFRKALRSASKGGAADLSGWHYEHLQLTLGRKSTYMSIVDVCSQIAKGCMTEDFYALSALGRVTASQGTQK